MKLRAEFRGGLPQTPQGLGVRQSSGAFGVPMACKSGRGCEVQDLGITHKLSRPVGAFIASERQTQGGARASLALGWFGAGPLALKFHALVIDEL